MTKKEFMEMIGASIEQKLLEILGDPDEGAGPSCYFRSETVAGNLNVVGLALPLLDDERQVNLR